MQFANDNGRHAQSRSRGCIHAIATSLILIVPGRDFARSNTASKSCLARAVRFELTVFSTRSKRASQATLYFGLRRHEDALYLSVLQ